MIEYITADGKRICVEVSPDVYGLLEQSDRQIRSQGRQDRRYLDFVGFIDGLSEACMKNPLEIDAADLVVKMEERKRLYEAVCGLPGMQRRRLMLYYSANLTHREIAELESVDRSAVSRSIKRAVERLRILLME